MTNTHTNGTQGATLRPESLPTLPYPSQARYALGALRFALLWVAFAAWFMFFVWPFFTGVHGVGIHHPAMNLPWMMIGLSLWTGMDAANEMNHTGRFCLFLFALALLAGWY